MKAVYLFVLITLLSSCAHTGSKKLSKENNTQEQLTSDDAACRSQAMAIQNSDPAYTGTFMEPVMLKSKQTEVFDLCMIGKGYRYL